MSKPTGQPLRREDLSKTYAAKAYAAACAPSELAPLSIRRRFPKPQDVQIDILHCGRADSDSAN
ncbi:MAG TPA: hypothetical protein VEO53_03635, partial [Candidatus Binatia bacterium]|nr:hypothetical protein [Candidatus Binatia bacterium]